MNRVRAMAVFTTLLAAACGDGGNSRVSVMLKDGPGPFKTAEVRITEVYLMGAGGKFVLSDSTKTVDLLTLANDVTPLVSERAVPKGTYDELRFVISGGYVVLQDDTVFASAGYPVPSNLTVTGELKMPSLAQSGLKVDMASPALAITGDTKILLVDFDVSQSFGHEAGSSSSWVMHPVIKGAEFTLSGNLVVNATLVSGVLPNGAALYAVVTPVSSVLSSEITLSPVSLPLVAVDPTHYTQTFKYLFPGDYLVTFEEVPQAPLTTSPAHAVTVASQVDTTVNFTVSSP